MEVKTGYKHTAVGVIPEEWESSKLGDFSYVTKLAGFEYTIHFDYSKSGPVIALRALNIKNGTLDLSEVHTIPRETSDSLPRSKLAKGDLVVSYVGTLGRVAMVPEDDKFHLAPNVAKICVDNEQISPEFLTQFLNSFKGQKLIFDAAASTTQAALSMRNLRGVAFVRPPLPEQRSIATALSDVDGLLGGLDRLIAKKRDLKQAAMQQLLTGQTRLPGFQSEWEETTLGEIGDCIIGLTYKPENVVEHGLLVLRSSNVQKGRLSFDDNVHVNLRVAEHLYTRLGDILVCVRNGSRALIGKCAVIDSAAVGVTFGAFMSVYRTKHWRFVLHAFQANSIQQQIRDNIGATINQITNKDMKAFRLRLPPADEQAAIAEVLTAMDEELSVLEQRREKTRTLKQAMMHELLTGKTRLA